LKKKEDEDVWEIPEDWMETVSEASRASKIESLKTKSVVTKGKVKE